MQTTDKVYLTFLSCAYRLVRFRPTNHFVKVRSCSGLIKPFLSTRTQPMFCRNCQVLLKQMWLQNVLSQSVVWQLSCGLCCQKDDGKYPSALGHFAAFRYFYRDVSTFSKIHLFFPQRGLQGVLKTPIVWWSGIKQRSLTWLHILQVFPMSY